MTEYADGTYKYMGNGEFERYDREAVGFWVSSTNLKIQAEGTEKLAMLALVERHGARYVGIWTADNGDRYVDKSHYTTDRELAESAGRNWDQQAIWDIANNEAIYLD